MTAAELNAILRTHESAEWAAFENDVAAAIAHAHARWPADTWSIQSLRGDVEHRLEHDAKGNFVRVLTHEQHRYVSWACEDACLAAWGSPPPKPIDPDAEPTPDDVRDQEAQADLLWAREMDANDSSRIRAAGR